MKKFMVFLLSSVLLLGCQKEPNTENKSSSKEEIKIKESKDIKEEVKEEKNLKSFETKDGEKIEFENLNLHYYLDRWHAPKFTLSEDDEKAILSLLSKLETEEVSQKPDIEMNSGFILKLDDKVMSIMPEFVDQYSNFHCSLIKDGKILQSFVCDKNLYNEFFSKLLENKIKNDFAKDWFKIESDVDLQVYVVDIIKTFVEGKELDDFVILANVANENYSFENGIFNHDSGAYYPLEIHYKIETPEKIKNYDKELFDILISSQSSPEMDKKKEELDKTFETAAYERNFVFDRFVQVQDGDDFYHSALAMARNDEELAQKLLDSQVSHNEIHDRVMDELSYKAEIAELKNFKHTLQNVPGYENDVVYIENDPNQPENTVEIAKKKDYEKAKSSVGKVNWPYCYGILYDRKTGISVNSIVDYFK